MAFENELKHLDIRIASTVVLYIKYQCTYTVYIGGQWFAL